jgi:hypothetical protein
MNKELLTKLKAIDPKKRNTMVVAILAVIVLVFIFVQISAPKRSIASYCKVFKEEKTRLSTLPGDTYPSGVFNEEISDAGEFASSFGKLEKVAPKEIQTDTATLKSIYQKIHDDPAQAISASLSGIGAETSVKKWTNQNCTP